MINQKKILILGAGRGQKGLVSAAKRMNLYTIVASIPGDYPCLPLADDVCYVDISNVDAVAEKAYELKPDGVVTCCMDLGMLSLGKTNDILGLCGLSYEQAELCVNKYEMKNRLVKNHVSTAEFYRVENETDLKVAIEKLNYPVIIKAVDLQGSRGINIAYDEMSAINGLKDSLHETSKNFCIVEKFIEGIGFGAEAFVSNGEILFVMLHGRETYRSKTEVPIGHYFPIELSSTIREKAERTVKQAIRALKLDNCAVDLDLITQDDEVYVIEITGRVGANCLPEMVGIHYGLDYYEMIIRKALGEDVKIMLLNCHNGRNALLAKMLVNNIRSGTIKELSYEYYNDKDVYDVLFFKTAGQYSHKFVDTRDCIGQYIIAGDNMEHCRKTEEKLMQHIIFKVEKR